jgi:hypothetical protein
MSEQIQRNAHNRADAARDREERARERARANRERGEDQMARIHQATAELHADAATAADTLLELDQALEGDQLPQDER